MTAKQPARVGVDGDSDAADPSSEPLAHRVRHRGGRVARRELARALAEAEGLTPAQRRTVAWLAGRIAAGVLAPAVDASDGTPAERGAVARLFAEGERVRDGR
jgi:hypothetical protein